MVLFEYNKSKISSSDTFRQRIQDGDSIEELRVHICAISGIQGIQIKRKSEGQFDSEIIGL